MRQRVDRTPLRADPTRPRADRMRPKAGLTPLSKSRNIPHLYRIRIIGLLYVNVGPKGCRAWFNTMSAGAGRFHAPQRQPAPRTCLLWSGVYRYPMAFRTIKIRGVP